METLKTLEFNTILEEVSSFCLFSDSAKKLLEERPNFCYENICNALNKTNEAFTLLYKFNDLDLKDILNFETTILHLESNILNIDDLFNIYLLFLNAKNILNYFEEYVPEYLEIEDIYFNENIFSIIKNIIDDNKSILDSASPKLKQIREDISNKTSKIKDILNKYISNSKYIQDNIITTRAGKYVIPIKAQYMQYVSGYIHDVSRNEQTYYVEPSSIYALNKEISKLKIQESEEIEHILNDLARKLYPLLDSLNKSYECILTLDIIFSKARYSKYKRYTLPLIGDINLKKCYHPYLKENIVKNDIFLNKDINTLIITGPNTGGKTVTLKTIGIIHLLAYYGIFIPASDNSSIGIFDNIFVDIGDDQSIEYNLSTFSSHLKNIIDITKNASSNSLILLDEIGAGTSPNEGESLAISILKYLSNLGSTTFATSHFDKVKLFALNTPHFENASIDFDMDSLSPTYKLNIGIPGKSYAFEISNKLGLDSSIILDAKKYLSSSFNFEDILKNINVTKNKLDLLKEENEEIKKSLIQKQDQLDLKLSDINEYKVKYKEEVRIASQKMLDDAKQIISEQLKNLDSKNVRELNNSRNVLNTKFKQLNASNFATTNSSDVKKDFSKLKSGDCVFVISLNRVGVVEDINFRKKSLRVSFGQMKYDTKFENIDFVNSSNNKKVKNENVSSYSVLDESSKQLKQKHISSSINVIGQNVLESIPQIDKYLDDAAVCGLSNVTIIHGNGSGTLRTAIHDFLKTNCHVKSFKIASFNNGGTGATEVELK